ncbi:MAG TPA: glycolate oxidase subunit GlcF [Alphaproteobacteria bacterium]|jgi:glycolate oxidase iron-sulfur subunit|nr:glycolate oxidase subunit GlcF [Alphaproteobacteria bacterium]
MKTAFTPDQLSRPEIAEAARILGDCVHYGFCTAVCPTYVLTRDENEGPRGRIDLMRAMLERGGAPDAKTVRHIDQCLSCNSCMTTCAAKVDYLHLADIGRAYIERHYKRPLGDRLTRWLVASTVPHAGRFRAATRLARLAKPIRGALPPRLRTMVELAPARLPARRDATAPGVYPAEGARRMRVALLTGCAQQALAPHVNAATIRLLTRHGCEVVVAEGAACCGALTLHMGREDEAKRAALSCIAAWGRELHHGGLDAIVVNASGCGTTVKDYGHLFAHDSALAERAETIGMRALDVTELVGQLGLEEPAQRIPLAVAYHDACSLQHAQKVTAPPRALLRAAGFIVADVPEKHFCCGSAGTYNLLQPAMAEALGRRKAAHIDSTGAAIVAAGNLGCMTQIARFSALPVVHTVELLDWATGGPLPEKLKDVALPAPEVNADEPVAAAPAASEPAAPADPGDAIW